MPIFNIIGGGSNVKPLEFTVTKEYAYSGYNVYARIPKTYNGKSLFAWATNQNYFGNAAWTCKNGSIEVASRATGTSGDNFNYSTDGEYVVLGVSTHSVSVFGNSGIAIYT